MTLQFRFETSFELDDKSKFHPQNEKKGTNNEKLYGIASQKNKHLYLNQYNNDYQDPEFRSESNGEQLEQIIRKTYVIYNNILSYDTL